MNQVFAYIKSRLWVPGNARRLSGLDSLRGVACVLMAVFHLCYALVAYYGFPQAWLSLPFLQFCQVASSRIFILLSGMTARLSKSNAKRGVFTLVCACIVTIVSMLYGDPIRFGILHFLGAAALLYAGVKKMVENLPPLAGFSTALVLYLAAQQVFPLRIAVGGLFPLGFVAPGFSSSDYYPLLPYFFLFLAGSYFFELIREQQWLKTCSIPVIEVLGRNSIVFYLLHQPVILAVLWVLF